MTRKCFFVQPASLADEQVTLSREVSRQLQSVLRMGPGDSIELRDGAGGGWLAEIGGSEKGGFTVRLVRPLDLSGTEPAIELTLGIALSRSEKMDLVVRQATELGVSRIVAFRAKRSQYGLSGRQAEARVERWVKIAREALCQCGRSKIPEVALLSGTAEFLISTLDGPADDSAIGVPPAVGGPDTRYPGAKRKSQSRRGESAPTKDESGGLLKLFAWEEELEQTLISLKHSFPECGKIIAVIGPEGGWDATEADGFIASGFHPVRLGPRVLRLETAAAVLTSAIQLLWGDFGAAEKGRADQHEVQ